MVKLIVPKWCKWVIGIYIGISYLFSPWISKGLLMPTPANVAQAIIFTPIYFSKTFFVVVFNHWFMKSNKLNIQTQKKFSILYLVSYIIIETIVAILSGFSPNVIISSLIFLIVGVILFISLKKIK